MASVKSDKDRLYSSQFLTNIQSSPIHQLSLPTLSIFNSLTGAKVLVNSFNFNSLDSLKEYISTCFHIPANLLFILTPFGIKLKFSMILHDQINEIYVFDRNCFNLNDHTRPELLARLKENDPFTLSKPMESPLLSYEGFKEDNVRGSINALKRNSGWAALLLSDFKKIQEANLKAVEQDDPIEIILRSLNVLIQYLSLSIQTLQKNLEGSFEYLKNLKTHSMILTWEDHYSILKKIAFNLAGTKINLANSLNKVELQQISKNAALKTSEADQLLESLNYRILHEFKNEKHALEQKCGLLREKYQIQSNKVTSSDSQILKLQSVVEEIVEDVNDLPPPETSDITLVKTCYEHHLEDLIPEIVGISTTWYQRQVKLHENRTSLQQALLDGVFLDVARIQINLINMQRLITNDLHPRLSSLQNSEARLSIVVDLPLIFGILIISKYKNYRWFQNFRKICFKTNEILEMLQFLETNSRSKWVSKILGIGSLNGTLNGKNGLLNHYRDHLGSLKQEDFIEDHMAVLQLLFETKHNNKVIIDTSANKNLNNKALSKFINTLNNNHSDENSSDQGNVWANLPVTNYKDIENYIRILRELMPSSGVPDRLDRYVVDCGLGYDATYDVNDLNYMKFYKKFLKNYEMDGFVLDFGDLEKSPSKSPELVDHGDAMIKGYESRVKKLENLLHQQQFLHFNQQFQPSSGITRNLNPLNNGTLNDGVNSIVTESNRQQILLPHNRKFSSGSVNSENKNQIDQLTEENNDLKLQIEELKLQLLAKNTVVEKPVDDSKMEKLSMELQNTKDELESTKTKLAELLQAHDKMKQDLNGKIEQWEQKHNDVNSMKKDLIENMSSLRKDHEEESTFHLKQIEELKFRVEELQTAKDEFQCLNTKYTDVIRDKNQVIESLSAVIESMYAKLKELSQRIFIDFSCCCVILESIGLLLIEENGEKKIIRVKGLKKNKSLKQQISSDVINQVEKSLYWTDLSIENETTSVKEMIRESSPVSDSEIIGESSISELDIHSKLLIHKFNNENFETNYQTFVKSFETGDDLLINSITKRFKDVENLARKYQKDLNSQKIELDNLFSQIQTKISIRNFHPNDLVLFLPTTEEFDKGNSTTKQWAAFNLGAPHYFLRNSMGNDHEEYIDLSNRDWLVARILNIEEFKITEENFNDDTTNPFKLSIGISWYSVDAKEEGIDLRFAHVDN